MTRLLKGENIKAQIYITDQYYDIFCAKACDLTIDQDELEVTSILSGSSREYLPGMMNAIMNVYGITTIDNTEDKIAITYIMQQSVRQQVRQWRMTLTADDGTDLQISFDGIIKTSTLTREGFGYGQASMVVRVSGDIDFDDVVLPPDAALEVYSDYWQTVNGQNYISGASTGSYTGTAYTLTATDEILAVGMEGFGYDLVSGTPTVGIRECRFTTSPQRITFPSDVIFDGTQRVFVMFKR